MNEEELSSVIADAAERCAHGGWIDEAGTEWEPLDLDNARARRDVLC